MPLVDCVMRILGDLCRWEVVTVLRPRLMVWPGAAANTGRRLVTALTPVVLVAFREAAAAAFRPVAMTSGDEPPNRLADEEHTSGCPAGVGDLNFAADTEN